MKNKKEVISRRSFLKAASTVGISAVSTTSFVKDGKVIRLEASPVWEEALDLIGEKLKKLRDDGEPEKVVLFSRYSSGLFWDTKFFDLYGTPNNVSYGDTCFEVVSRSSQTIPITTRHRVVFQDQKNPHT